MKRILDTADTTSETFILKRPASGEEVVQCVIALHSDAGGTWKWQVQCPDGTWVDTGTNFTDNGIKNRWSPVGTPMRLTGGTAGAEAFATGIV